MVKIKLNLFEGVASCTIFPVGGFIFTTLILIISLFGGSINVIGKWIAVSYMAWFMLFALSLIVCFLINDKSEKELIVSEKTICFNESIYEISEIVVCQYYKCKWYCLPIVYIYKRGLAGQIYFKFKDGRKAYFKILYSDFLKINNKIPNIILK